MKKSKFTWALGCLLILSACSTKPAREIPQALIPSEALLVPAEPLENTEIRWNEDLIGSYLELVSDRNIIAARLNELIQWVRDLETNIQEN